MSATSNAGARPRLAVLSLSITTALLGLTTSLVAPISSAQEAAAQKLEEVVVTGTRIVRRDYDSNSPIVTVNAADFETQTGLNVESYLNKLPQYNPAGSPVTTDGDVQITPVNSVGIASISLRGFGANRSLVLVDGKRIVPINSLMVTDINSVPSALVERVETITGGASAVYGADAVGGVTNFILKDNFEGLDLDLQTGATAEGDGSESRLSAVLGTNFSDRRGNVTIGIEAYKRQASYERDHALFHEWWARPDTPGTFGLQGVNGYQCNGPDCPPDAIVRAVFADRPAGSFPFNPNGPQTGARGFLFSPDGTIFTNSRGGLYRANGTSRFSTPIDGSEYVGFAALDSNLPAGQTALPYQNVKWNHQNNFLEAPQERYSFFASGHLAVTDSIRAFARATFAESQTRTVLFGTSAISGWEASVGYNPITDSPVNPALNYTDPAVVAQVLANPAAFANPGFIPTGGAGAQHPVPAQLAILLNSRPRQPYCLLGTTLVGGPVNGQGCGNFGTNTIATQNPAIVGTLAPQGFGRWQPQWNPNTSLPPRNTFNTNEQWQVDAGLNFEIGKDWTGEFFLSHGQSSSYGVAGGNLSLERYRQLVDQPDYGRGAKISGNEPPNSIRPFFGAGDVTCTSGLYGTYFLGDRPMSDDCYQAINATLQTRAQNVQNIIELNFQGPVANMRAGELRVAAGYQGRRNAAKFFPDGLQSEVSFADQVIGVYPTGYLDASTEVSDFYVEALVPLIGGKKWAKRLELELGARASDYQHTDKETTYKSLINWQVTDWLRFRGGFNRATRAPNLGELFLNPQELFTGGGAFGDACGIRSNSPYGAAGTGPDPVMTTGEVAPVLAPGQTAAGAASTKLICQALMGGAASTRFYTVDNATGTVGGGFAWVMQRGNQNLHSEVADTWTWGLVANLSNNMTLAFDWYKTDIEDAIMLYSLTYAGYLCFGTQVGTAADAAIQAATPACQNLPRDTVNGAPLTSAVSYANQATIKTSGMDVALNWSKAVGAGKIGFNLNGTILDSYRTRTSPAPFDPETEWKGSLGPTLTGTNGGAYAYRLFGGVTYSRSDWNVGLRWRHLPSVYTAAYATQQAIKKNNYEVATGAASGILLGYTPTTEVQSNSYNIFDLSLGWNINNTLSIRGGISNLLDTKPEVVGATTGYPTSTTLANVCAERGGFPGCQAPVAFSVPTSGTWNAGYYDTIGRSFFVGMSAKF